MFEFWKRLSKEDKIKKISSGNRVTYVASKELKKEIRDWNKDTYLRDVDFSELLYKLGFDKERILYLERVSDMDNISIRYGYDGEIDGNNRIDLCEYDIASGVGRFKPYDKKIKLLGDGYKNIYVCTKNTNLEDSSDFNLELIIDSVSRNLDNYNIYERSLGITTGLNISFKNMRTVHYNGSDLVVRDGYYDEIIIKVIPNQINFINNDIMKMENEDKLIDYLDSITEDTRIEDIYKKICEISLGEEDKYRQIEIIIKRLDKEEARLSYFDEQKVYKINFGYKYQVNDGDRNYTYEYVEPNKYGISSLCCLKIKVSKGEEHFVLTANLKDYVREMKLNNSLELRDYLCGLEFPIFINDVYKKLCEIYFGDINKYGWINIECYHGRDTIEGDKILSFRLENGEFKLYQVNKDGKEIKITNDDKFSYVNKSFSKQIVVDMIDEVVTNCQFSSENGIECDDMSNSIYNGINEAKDVKIRTKKMIDKMLNKDNS